MLDKIIFADNPNIELRYTNIDIIKNVMFKSFFYYHYILLNIININKGTTY